MYTYLWWKKQSWHEFNLATEVRLSNWLGRTWKEAVPTYFKLLSEPTGTEENTKTFRMSAIPVEYRLRDLPHTKQECWPLHRNVRRHDWVAFRFVIRVERISSVFRSESAKLFTAGRATKFNSRYRTDFLVTTSTRILRLIRSMQQTPSALW
jgi:hypothetical protein